MDEEKFSNNKDAKINENTERLIDWLIDRWTYDTKLQAQTTMTYPCNNLVQRVHFILYSRSNFSCNKFLIFRLLKTFWNV